MNRKERIFLLIIVLVASFFRIYHLSVIPPSPSLDEVSIGYNAYSILKTGADEYGNRLPILLRAYDDWRPALYVYLVVPFVKLLGLDVLAVRLPSVILSTLTIVATYFLAKELFSRNIALLTVGLLAISPWHIYISRLGHEVNAAFSFLIFGLLFFVRYINRSRTKRNYVNLFLSVLFLGLSFDSYQSTKIVIPLLLLTLLLLFYKELLLRKKTLVISCVMGFLVILPILLETLKPEGLIRFRGTNLFVSSSETLQKNAKQLVKDRQEGNWIGLIIHNRRVVYASLFANAYFSHFNPTWLFTNRVGEQFKVPGFGLLYIFELPLLLLGVLVLLKSHVQLQYKIFLLSWFFIGILPGAITTGYPHAMRIFNVLPVPQIFIALGIVSVLQAISTFKNSIPKSFVVFVIIFAYGFFVVSFYSAYFVRFSRELSYQFQYGVLQALSFANSIESKYDTVVVSNKKNLFQSYMFYLFATRYDPLLYQKNGDTKSGGFEAEHRIGKFEFKNFPFKDVRKGRILYVTNPDQVSNEAKILKTFYFLDGKPAIVLAEK